MSRAASPSDLVAAARAAGIAGARVLAAIGATPRAGFVPAHYLTDAYRDEPGTRKEHPGHGQAAVISAAQKRPGFRDGR